MTLIPGETRQNTHSAKILFVEDTEDVRNSYTRVLQGAGYVVRSTSDGTSGLREIFAFQPDLVILDILLPDGDGVFFCRQTKMYRDVPVIMLTAIGRQDVILRAFAEGADDYVQKGAPTAELLARIKSVLRRSSARGPGVAGSHYRDAQVHVDFERNKVWVRDQQIDLTPIEYGLLAALISRNGRPATSSELLHEVWQQRFDPEIVKWHIGRLRRKIEEDSERPILIRTRRGFGYSYDPPEIDQSDVRGGADVLVSAP